MSLKILLLEDVEDDAMLIVRVLKRNKVTFISERVDNRADFINYIDTFKPDVILSDYSLPQFSPLEALKICQSRQLNIPFILVTGAVSDEFAVECLKLGADDYLLKSNLSRLPTAVQSALNQRRLIEKRKKDEEILRSKNEELSKVNEDLDNFMYSVSHNLRQPLASILGLINITKYEDAISVIDLKNYISLMEESAHRLDKTLKDILEYSRNTKIEITPQKIDLTKVFEECFESLKYVERFNSIERLVEVSGSFDFYTDYHRLRVILTNLLSNGLKFIDTSKSIHHLHISATLAKDEVIIFVSDNGIGIENEYLSKIFNMFYRATTQSKGSGIGLYIAKEAIAKLHGTITVESKVGEGTIFILTIPNGASKCYSEIDHQTAICS